MCYYTSESAPPVAIACPSTVASEPEQEQEGDGNDCNDADEVDTDPPSKQVTGFNIDLYDNMKPAAFVTWKKKFPKQVHAVLGKYSPESKAHSPSKVAQELYDQLTEDEKADFGNFNEANKTLEVLTF